MPIAPTPRFNPSNSAAAVPSAQSRPPIPAVDRESGAERSRAITNGAPTSLEHISLLGDVLIEQEYGRFVVGRIGANRQLTFRYFPDALRLSVAFGDRNHVSVWVVGMNGYQPASEFDGAAVLTYKEWSASTHGGLV